MHLGGIDRSVVLAGILLAVVHSPGSAAGPTQDAAPGRLTPLSERAWVWTVEREPATNGALLVGDVAALAVDPGLTPVDVERFLAAARGVSDRPLRWVVLTHEHPFHALGALCTPERGFELIAHPAARRALAERAWIDRRHFSENVDDAAVRSELSGRALDLPERTVAEREVFDLGGHAVEVFHPGTAHTAGDLVVWSPDESVLVAGDLVMGEACPTSTARSFAGWLAALRDLERLEPRHVIPGHFATGGPEVLVRFRTYVEAALERAEAEAAGSAVPGAVAAVDSSFADTPWAAFRQLPEFGATFEGNLRAMVAEARRRPPAPGAGVARAFVLRKSLDVGRAPHQVAFSPDGTQAFVAVTGSDRVVTIDVESLEIVATREVAGAPIGVAGLPGGGLLVTGFRSGNLAEVPAGRGDGHEPLAPGEGTSLLVGPLPGGLWLGSTESADRLWVIDGEGFELRDSFPTGARPFPPAATADGRKAFVPDHDGGTVTVVDLWNRRVLETVPVGERPSGGALIEDLHAYAVALRGEDRVVFLNTASHRPVLELSEGIGAEPFSVVAAPDGALAFVNNVGSHDVSVVALRAEGGPRVIARVPTGEIPITLAVHPSGRTLWVACEGSHELQVFSIPELRGLAGETPGPERDVDHPTPVLVLGMIHGGHVTSETWGIDEVSETIRRYDPDVVCVEIPPERWERAWREYAETGAVEEPRVGRFPEYLDALLPLKIELGFAVEPCAGWTQELSDLRQARMAEFSSDPALADQHAAYRAAEAAVRAELESGEAEGARADDDPRFIHSVAYDERTRRELEPYDRFLNDWIGPGGWTNVNRAHWELIERALERHRGRRVLVTFGAGHKHWFLDRLRERDDVLLVDVEPYLPEPRPR